MNNFLLILSHREEPSLVAIYEQAQAALRPASQRMLPIRPHLILFRRDGDLAAQAHTLRPVLAAHDNWVLIAVGPDFRGFVLPDQMEALADFFRGGHAQQDA